MKKKMMMRSLSVVLDANTFIGGVALSFPSAESLAERLNIEAARITNYVITGNNVSCTIINSYTIPARAFELCNLSYFEDTAAIANLTSSSFRNLGGTGATYIRLSINIVNPTADSIFQDSRCVALYLDNCVSLNSRFLGNWNSQGTRLLHIPKVVNFGPSQDNNLVFRASNCTNTVMNINILNQTSNNGGIEGDVAFAIANGANVNFVL